MPFRKERYPADWKRISSKIRERDHNRCKFCGVRNHAVGYRDRDGAFHVSEGMQQEADMLDGRRLIRIVLTVAHLDHDTSNNDPDNLAALCQRCHLRYDAALHAANASTTRDRKRGQTRFCF